MAVSMFEQIEVKDDFEDFLKRLYPQVEDDIYHCLKSVLTATGRGRRPTIPKVKPTNRLLLQMFLLKTNFNRTWKDIEELVGKLLPNLPANKCRSLIERVVILSKNASTDEEMKDVLTEELKLDLAGKRLESRGINRTQLLDPLAECWQELDKTIPLSNAIVVELEHFKTKEKLTFPIMKQWIAHFNTSHNTITDLKLRKKIKQLKDKYSNALRSKNKKGGEEVLSKLLEADFFETTDDKTTTVKTAEITNITDAVSDCDNMTLTSPITTEIIPENVTDHVNSKHHENITRALQIKTLNGKLHELEKELAECRDTITVLQTCGIEKSGKLAMLELQCDTKQAECETLKTQISDLNEQLKEITQRCEVVEKCNRSIQKGNYYKRVQRREEKLDHMQDVLKRHEQNNCDSRIKSLQSKTKHLQTLLSNLRQTLTKCKSEKFALMKERTLLETEIKEWKDDVADLKHELEELKGMQNTKSIHTREDASTKFTPDVIKCVIELIGEAEVSAERCGQVIQIVSKHIHHKHISIGELPSRRTALRFADRGHYLAKYHIAEQLISSDRWDLHTDGTSKDHHKYVGHQVTLDDGQSLSCAFTGVDVEDSDTLLDVATNLLRELADVFDPDEAEEHFVTMLKKLTGLMSDRASVMKAFDKEMNKTRQEILRTKEDLQFLHCNAHFLLGLSSTCEKVIKKMEKDLGEKLGRDALPCFKKFQSAAEGATVRYVRLACDSLAPRGDEKNGCRDSWEAFCRMKKISSELTSFKSNRFNNFFQGAASLHYHRDQIIDFLSNYKVTKNLKLQSVLADAQSDDIDSFVIALGLVYFHLSGPYWLLVKSDRHYLDFYRYAEKMKSMLVKWSEDSSSLTKPGAPPLFDDFVLKSDQISDSLFDISNEKRGRVQEILQEISKGFLIVLERQLADFLDGGRYHNVDDAELREKMKHSKLTNLIGEACFGDLDYSIFKRRHASLHHHGTVNMLKRNKTISAWFDKKPEEEQIHLLQNSTSKAVQLRNKHQHHQKEIIESRKQLLVKQKSEKEAKELITVEKKRTITMKVKENGGPCIFPKDVRDLLNRIDANNQTDRGTKGQKLDAIRAEIQHQKLVLGFKSPNLKLSGSLDEITQRLITHLTVTESETNLITEETVLSNTDDSCVNEDCLETVVEETPTPVRKSKRLLIESTYTSDSNSESESDQPCKRKELSKFQFSQPGTWVAVYFDDNYYLGQVLSLKSKTVGEVQFLEKCGLTKKVFRWPVRDDVTYIESKYVFLSDFELTTSNGRTWSMQKSEVNKIDRLYKEYKKMYC